MISSSLRKKSKLADNFTMNFLLLYKYIYIQGRIGSPNLGVIFFQGALKNKENQQKHSGTNLGNAGQNKKRS
jgi:hypothetical protein